MYTEDDQNVKLQQTNAKQVTPEPEKTQELENKFFSNPVGGPKEADVVELENEPEQESLDLNYKDPNAINFDREEVVPNDEDGDNYPF